MRAATSTSCFPDYCCHHPHGPASRRSCMRKLSCLSRPPVRTMRRIVALFSVHSSHFCSRAGAESQRRSRSFGALKVLTSTRSNRKRGSLVSRRRLTRGHAPYRSTWRQCEFYGGIASPLGGHLMAPLSLPTTLGGQRCGRGEFALALNVPPRLQDCVGSPFMGCATRTRPGWRRPAFRPRLPPRAWATPMAGRCSFVSMRTLQLWKVSLSPRPSPPTEQRVRDGERHDLMAWPMHYRLGTRAREANGFCDASAYVRRSEPRAHLGGPLEKPRNGREQHEHETANGRVDQ